MEANTISRNILDDFWWDDFLVKNENFSKTNVFKDALTKPNVDKMNTEVLNILINMSKFNTNVEGFRFYLDGEEQNEKYVVNNVFSNPPLEGETIEQYADRVFNGQKFAIIMNFTEKYSNEMAKTVRLLLDPLIQKLGTPLLGLDGTIFIGNYGYTPLGIHRDRRGENVIHFHLGPGDKIMYNWENDIYDKKADSKTNNTDIEPLLEDAIKYQFRTGDIYYMPWDKWHVGYSGDLSVAFTLWFNNPTKETYTKQMFKSFAIQYIQKNDAILTIDTDTSNIEPLLSVQNLSGETKVIDLLNHVSNEYRYAILSNGGWSGLPLTLSSEKKFNIDEEYNLLDKAKVQAPPFFKLYSVVFEEELTFFARGYKMEIKYHPELEKIIEKLNTNQVFKVDDLIKKLKKDWPKEACLYFLAMLYDKKAIEIVYP
nr:hypothetical protein [uncultured Flavobacterium sp.]